MDFKKIIVAYDGSESSQKAVEWAVALAGKLKSNIVAVSVVRMPDISPDMGDIQKVYSEGIKYYRPLLEKVVKYGEEHNVLLQTEILRGHPADTIVRYAYERNADLIVMGSRGLGGFASLIIGSVAQKVVSYSEVPVAVIK